MNVQNKTLEKYKATKEKIKEMGFKNILQFEKEGTREQKNQLKTYLESLGAKSNS